MKTIFFLLLGLLILSHSPAASGEFLMIQNPETAADRFAANPRNVKDIGDPFILVENDAYHLFATGGPVGFNVWHSGDLVSFDKQKALKKVDWASGDYWAPEVFPVGDRYVMLFTARMRENGSLRTGIAFSSTPEGPYEDPLGKPLMDFGYATIDATLTWDEEGKPYLIYVRDCSENMVSGHGESHIYGVPLANDLLSVEGEPVLLLKPEGDWETKSADPLWNEGPSVVHRNGKYYLFYSVNGYFMKEYSVCAAVADAPLGPYQKQENNPLLYPVENGEMVTVSGPGHNAFFTVGEELFTAYHTHTYPQAPSGNRQLCVDRAGFHADGTAFINGPTLAPQLKPLAEIGCADRIQCASASEDPRELLKDGDFCLRKSSVPWVWHGNEVTFRWKEPAAADLLMIYPFEGKPVSGKITINEKLEADFTFDGNGKPGSAVILPFAPVTVECLKVEFSEETDIGEILLIGAEST